MYENYYILEKKAQLNAWLLESELERARQRHENPPVKANGQSRFGWWLRRLPGLKPALAQPVSSPLEPTSITARIR